MDLYLSYGSTNWHDGAEVFNIDKASRRRIEQAFGGKRALRAIEPMLDGYIVVGDSQVITVAHQQHRRKHDVHRWRG